MSNINYMLKTIAGKIEMFFCRSVLGISHAKQSPEEYFSDKLHPLPRYCPGSLPYKFLFMFMPQLYLAWKLILDDRMLLHPLSSLGLMVVSIRHSPFYLKTYSVIEQYLLSLLYVRYVLEAGLNWGPHKDDFLMSTRQADIWNIISTINALGYDGRLVLHRIHVKITTSRRGSRPSGSDLCYLTAQQGGFACTGWLGSWAFPCLPYRSFLKQHMPFPARGEVRMRASLCCPTITSVCLGLQEGGVIVDQQVLARGIYLLLLSSSLLIVLVFYCCCNKLPQTLQLKTTQIYHLAVV